MLARPSWLRVLWYKFRAILAVGTLPASFFPISSPALLQRRHPYKDRSRPPRDYSPIPLPAYGIFAVPAYQLFRPGPFSGKCTELVCVTRPSLTVRVDF